MTLWSLLIASSSRATIPLYIFSIIASCPTVSLGNGFSNLNRFGQGTASTTGYRRPVFVAHRANLTAFYINQSRSLPSIDLSYNGLSRPLSGGCLHNIYLPTRLFRPQGLEGCCGCWRLIPGKAGVCILLPGSEVVDLVKGSGGSNEPMLQL